MHTVKTTIGHSFLLLVLFYFLETDGFLDTCSKNEEDRLCLPNNIVKSTIEERFENPNERVINKRKISIDHERNRFSNPTLESRVRKRDQNRRKMDGENNVDSEQKIRIISTTIRKMQNDNRVQIERKDASNQNIIYNRRIPINNRSTNKERLENKASSNQITNGMINRISTPDKERYLQETRFEREFLTSKDEIRRNHRSLEDNGVRLSQNDNNRRQRKTNNQRVVLNTQLENRHEHQNIRSTPFEAERNVLIRKEVKDRKIAASMEPNTRQSKDSSNQVRIISVLRKQNSERKASALEDRRLTARNTNRQSGERNFEKGAASLEDNRRLNQRNNVRKSEDRLIRKDINILRRQNIARTSLEMNENRRSTEKNNNRQSERLVRKPSSEITDHSARVQNSERSFFEETTERNSNRQSGYRFVEERSHSNEIRSRLPFSAPLEERRIENSENRRTTDRNSIGLPKNRFIRESTFSNNIRGFSTSRIRNSERRAPLEERINRNNEKRRTTERNNNHRSDDRLAREGTSFNEIRDYSTSRVRDAETRVSLEERQIGNNEKRRTTDRNSNRLSQNRLVRERKSLNDIRGLSTSRVRISDRRAPLEERRFGNSENRRTTDRNNNGLSENRFIRESTSSNDIQDFSTSGVRNSERRAQLEERIIRNNEKHRTTDKNNNRQSEDHFVRERTSFNEIRDFSTLRVRNTERRVSLEERRIKNNEKHRITDRNSNRLSENRLVRESISSNDIQDFSTSGVRNSERRAPLEERIIRNNKKHRTTDRNNNRESEDRFVRERTSSNEIRDYSTSKVRNTEKRVSLEQRRIENNEKHRITDSNSNRLSENRLVRERTSSNDIQGFSTSKNRNSERKTPLEERIIKIKEKHSTTDRNNNRQSEDRFVRERTSSNEIRDFSISRIRNAERRASLKEKQIENNEKHRTAVSNSNRLPQNRLVRERTSLNEIRGRSTSRVRISNRSALLEERRIESSENRRTTDRNRNRLSENRFVRERTSLNDIEGFSTSRVRNSERIAPLEERIIINNEKHRTTDRNNNPNKIRDVSTSRARNSERRVSLEERRIGNNEIRRITNSDSNRLSENRLVRENTSSNDIQGFSTSKIRNSERRTPLKERTIRNNEKHRTNDGNNNRQFEDRLLRERTNENRDFSTFRARTSEKRGPLVERRNVNNEILSNEIRDVTTSRVRNAERRTSLEEKRIRESNRLSENQFVRERTSLNKIRDFATSKVHNSERRASLKEKIIRNEKHRTTERNNDRQSEDRLVRERTGENRDFSTSRVRTFERKGSLEEKRNVNGERRTIDKNSNRLSKKELVREKTSPNEIQNLSTSRARNYLEEERIVNSESRRISEKNNHQSGDQLVRERTTSNEIQRHSAFRVQNSERRPVEEKRYGNNRKHQTTERNGSRLVREETRFNEIKTISASGPHISRSRVSLEEKRTHKNNDGESMDGFVQKTILSKNIRTVSNIGPYYYERASLGENRFNFRNILSKTKRSPNKERYSFNNENNRRHFERLVASRGIPMQREDFRKISEERNQYSLTTTLNEETYYMNENIWPNILKTLFASMLLVQILTNANKKEYGLNKFHDFLRTAKQKIM